MAAGPGAGEQENGNAPNFYKLLRPLLQRQQPSRCARARISGQSLVTSNYNLRQGGRRGGEARLSPQHGHPMPPLSAAPRGGTGTSPAHRYAHLGWGAQGHRIPLPALDQDMGHIWTLLLPGACQIIPPQHLRPLGRTSSPRDAGTPVAQCTRTRSPVPSPPRTVSG